MTIKQIPVLQCRDFFIIHTFGLLYDFKISVKDHIIPSTKNIRAICTDIDGTLLDSRRELSARTIAAIKSLGKDIPVILASSRMPGAMYHLQSELEILHHPLICFNGGYAIHVDGKKTAVVLDSVRIAAGVCSSIVNQLKGTGLHVSIFEEDRWYSPAEDQWTEREARITKATPIITDLDPVLERWNRSNTGAHKIMCMGDEEEIHKMEALLTKTYPDQIHIYRSKSTYLELAPKAISKASSLQLVLKKCFDIDLSEVMAFGDNYNDIEMIRSVGFGIAVGNARDEVKAVAKEITLNSKEDGVAAAIEKYLL